MRRRINASFLQTIVPTIALSAVLLGTLQLTGVIAAAQEDNPIENFHEVVPSNRCVSEEGARPRAAGTLFRGSRLDEEGILYLSEHGVKTILNLETDAALKEMNLLENLRNDHQLKTDTHEIHHSMTSGMGVNSLPDGSDDHEAILSTLADLRRSDLQPEYVHCRFGEDRTGLIIALHRVFNECWNPNDAEKEWNQYENWYHYLFNLPKHAYFHRVTEDPRLREYFFQRLAQLVPAEAQP